MKKLFWSVWTVLLVLNLWLWLFDAEGAKVRAWQVSIGTNGLQRIEGATSLYLLVQWADSNLLTSTEITNLVVLSDGATYSNALAAAGLVASTLVAEVSANMTTAVANVSTGYPVQYLMTTSRVDYKYMGPSDVFLPFDHFVVDTHNYGFFGSQVAGLYVVAVEIDYVCHTTNTVFPEFYVTRGNQYYGADRLVATNCIKLYRAQKGLGLYTFYGSGLMQSLPVTAPLWGSPSYPNRFYVWSDYNALLNNATVVGARATSYRLR